VDFAGAGDLEMTAWWQRHWFSEVPPHIFAALRIAVGLSGCLTMLGLLDVPLLLSLDGIVAAPGGGLGIRTAIQRSGLGTAAGWAIYFANAVAFAALVVGWRTGLMSLVAFVASAALIWWNPLPLSAGQHLLHMLTLFLVLSESGLVWSLDAWGAKRRGAPFVPKVQPVWPLRLLQYQVCLMYSSAALWKFLDPVWRDGTALHYVLNYNVTQRVPLQVPPALEPALAGFTYGTLAWETLFTPAMLHRICRRITLAVGVAMHLGMWVLLDIGPFTPTVLTAYIAFIDAEDARWIAERWSRFGMRARQSAPAKLQDDRQSRTVIR
jgi:hypothetical protein